MSKLLEHMPALCNIVRRLAIEAGDITLNYFDEGGGVFSQEKADGSPVTDADRLAEAHIIKELRAYFPDMPIIGEEAAASGETYRLEGQEHFWLIDPLDGTREFVAGSPDYTVNIALVKNQVPVLGVIYAPAHGEMYSAYGEGTAMRWLEDTGNEKSIRVRKAPRNGLIVMTSKNRAGEEINQYLEEQKVEKIIRKGSSLKICAVAAGKADLYPGFGETCEWDTAAGHAILKAAGGSIVDFETGAELTYGDKASGFSNPKFLAHSGYLS